MRSYFGILPANIRYDKKLTANAKLLYSELTALTNEKGYCWATNGYFADLYSVSKNSITNWLKSLSDAGYITVKYVYKYETKELIERRIYLNLGQDIEYTGQNEPMAGQEDPHQNNLDTPPKNIGDPNQNILDTPPKNFGDPPQKILEDNNTINNTVNNTFNNPPYIPQGESECEINKSEERADKAIKAITRNKEMQKTIKEFANNDLKMIDALKEFYKARSMLKKPLTARAMKLNLNNLKRLTCDRDEQIAIVEQSIQKGWQSFYELPQNHPYQEKKKVNENAKLGYVF